MSEASIACPYAAGAAGYVKSFHPKWSPAAVKSALMTTAKIEVAELAYGSGQINPTKALHPGLIYDMNEDSYNGFLCQQGYRNKDISIITGKPVNCSTFQAAKGHDGLNYPSMHVQLINTTKILATFYRTVAYVGQGKSVFKAKFQSTKTLSITITPNTLVFSKPYQRKSFTVTLNGFIDQNFSWYLSEQSCKSIKV